MRGAKETLEAIEDAARLDEATRDVLAMSDDEMERELVQGGYDIETLRRRARENQAELRKIAARGRRPRRRALAIAAAAGWLVALGEGAFLLQRGAMPVGERPPLETAPLHVVEQRAAPFDAARENQLPTLPAP
jgi:hypothetical protein